MTLAPIAAIKSVFGKADADRAQVQTDADTLKDLDDRFRRAREDRRKYEGEWQTSLAFLKGQHWLQWSRQRQALYQPPVPPWRQRVTKNLTGPTMRTMLGKLLANPTQAKVQAANNTPEAAQDARAQDEFIDYLRTVCRSEKVEEEAARWLLATGTEIHHPCWDKSLGDELTYPDTLPSEGVDPTGAPLPDQPHPMAGQPMREPNKETGEDDGTGNVVHMGEIDHVAVSPFQFFPEPGVENIEDMEWCLYVSVKPASYVNRRYGTHFDDETVPTDEFVTYTTASDESSGGTTQGVLLKRFWERPNNEYPEGRYVVYANDEVLFSGPNPYPKFPIPFVVGRDRTAVPGRFWGRSVVADLVPLQRAYNKLNSQAAEIREATARPKWHAFKGSLIPGKPITTAPAEVLETMPVPNMPDGGRPTKIEGGDVPQSFMVEAASIERQFYEIAGLHDFSRGTQGLAGGKTAAGLRMLIEQDDTRMGILKREHDRTIVDVETAMLKLAKQFYIEPRAITVVGPDMATEVHQFFAEKIGDDPQVRLVTSGSLPLSYAAREDTVFGWMERGIVTDQRIIRKLLGLSTMPGVGDSLDLDVRQAERENQMMKQGQIPQAHDYDNHLVHGQEHDDYRKGEEYEQLAASNPSVAQAFDGHVALHKQFIAAAMQPTVPPKVTLAGKLTPQQEAAEFGMAHAPQGQPSRPIPIRPQPQPQGAIA